MQMGIKMSALTSYKDYTKSWIYMFILSVRHSFGVFYNKLFLLFIYLYIVVVQRTCRLIIKYYKHFITTVFIIQTLLTGGV